MIYHGKAQTRGTDHQPLQRFPWEQHLHTWLQHVDDPKVYIPDLIVTNSLGSRLVGSVFPHEHKGLRGEEQMGWDSGLSQWGPQTPGVSRGPSACSKDAAPTPDILGSPPTHSLGKYD